MLWKRQIPILIVAVIGTLTLFGWFVNEPLKISWMMMRHNGSISSPVLQYFLGVLIYLKCNCRKYYVNNRDGNTAYLLLLDSFLQSLLDSFTKGTLMLLGEHTSQLMVPCSNGFLLICSHLFRRPCLPC